MRKRALLVASLVAALLLGAGVTWAAIPSGDSVIHGCYRTSNPAIGSLIVIDAEAGQICPSGTAPLNWNQTGPQGSPGGLAGWEIITVLTDIDTAQTKAATANCPSGKIVVGGGGFTGGSSHAITNSFAQFNGTAWQMTATKLNPNDGQSWRLVVQAICATPA
jgi:hypothetical protein